MFLDDVTIPEMDAAVVALSEIVEKENAMTRVSENGG